MGTGEDNFAQNYIIWYDTNTMKYYVLALGMLLPVASFAATPNEQYVSFLQQEISVLQAELTSLQATTTPATTTPVIESNVVWPNPGSWKAPAACGGSHNVAELYEEGIDCAPPVFTE